MLYTAILFLSATSHKFSENKKSGLVLSMPLMTNEFAHAVACPSCTLCATHSALFPVSSGSMCIIHTSLPSATVIASPLCPSSGAAE